MRLRLAAASLHTSAQLLTYASRRSNYGTVSGTTFTLDATVFVDLSPGYGRNASNVTALNNRCGLGHNGWLDEARFYNRVLPDAKGLALANRVLATLNAQASAAPVQLFPYPVGMGVPLVVRPARSSQPVPGTGCAGAGPPSAGQHRAQPAWRPQSGVARPGSWLLPAAN